MGVYYTSKAQANGGGQATGVGAHRALHVLDAQVAMTVAMSSNADDDCGLFYAPPGFVVIGGTISCTDMDSSTGLLFDVGIAGTEALFFAASAVGQAATFSAALAPAGHFYKFTARTEVRVFINTTQSGTAAAGTLKVALIGFIDPDYSTTALTGSLT